MRKTRFMLLRKLHGKLYESKLRRKLRKKLQKKYIVPYLKKAKKSRCVFLVLTPEHTNLGDHAIALSEILLLQSMSIDYIEITGRELAEIQRNRCLDLFNKYPIIINGGGNLGTLWFDVEQLMRDIILHAPKSRIFIYPNTFYYEDTQWGIDELKRSVSIYNSHKKLHIYARENISFEKMSKFYDCVKLVPDMVLLQNQCDAQYLRKGCLLCLRTDCEKTLTIDEETVLLRKLMDVFNENIKYTDTHSVSPVIPNKREPELIKKYNEFKRAELVVTDRLHGMIFCAITGTPCIVLNSKSPKVMGCYEWISDLGYIKICNDVTQIQFIYESIEKKDHIYTNQKLQVYFQQLKCDLDKYL